MSIPQIQSELLDDYAIKLSDDAIAKYIQRYQVMLAARQQGRPEVLRRQYESVDEIIPSRSTASNLRRDMRPCTL